MSAYYNEIDAFCAQWLRNLIAEGLIAPGDVDERSIEDVQPDDLRGYRQIHLFAGVGGWSFALRLVGWPDDEHVWTGSAPCPPWSRARIWNRDTAGERDARDLWPEQHRLVRECRPGIFFGEQVAGKAARGWLDRCERDMREAGYALHAEELCARDFGAPINRPRFYLAAEPVSERGPRLVAGTDTRPAGPWGWRGEEDMRAIADAPFVAGDRWPQPLLRKMDDGVSGRVGRLRACGNAIVPQVAAEFVKAYMEC